MDAALKPKTSYISPIHRGGDLRGFLLGAGFWMAWVLLARKYVFPASPKTEIQSLRVHKTNQDVMSAPDSLKAEKGNLME